jgi:hypothetical protein
VRARKVIGLNGRVRDNPKILVAGEVVGGQVIEAAVPSGVRLERAREVDQQTVGLVSVTTLQRLIEGERQHMVCVKEDT